MKSKFHISELSISHKDIILIFGIAFFLRLLFLIFMLRQHDSGQLINIVTDSVKYLNAAHYILGYGESGFLNLYLVGPGYPSLLALFTPIFGKAFWVLFLTQITLSCLTSILIYNIAILLLENRRMALLAGILASVSITSISLSNAIVSETPFLFFWALSLYMLLKGFDSNRWKFFIGAGIIGGMAILTRSVAQFFPIFIIVFAIIIPLKNKSIARKQIIVKSLIACLIILTITSIWAFKNYSEHDVFTVSGTGIIAAKIYLSAKTIYADKPDSEFVKIKDSLFYPEIINGQSQNIRERHQGAQKYIWSTFKKHPLRFIKTYLSNIWDNITVGSYIHHLQLPEFLKVFRYLEKRISRNNRSPIPVILSLGGFIIMLVGKLRRQAFILLLIYLYFAMLSGVTFWQGSRVFFPALASGAILMSVSLTWIYDKLKNHISRYKKSRLV